VENPVKWKFAKEIEKDEVPAFFTGRGAKFEHSMSLSFNDLL